ncbi:MAG: type II toxin-antitoxin system VapC family toxin [Candidatus Pacebacteria bacterium]|nr:type II toxin-antitoxin system VapC family toxin [Candidatus Paceibacterota bacterium]
MRGWLLDTNILRSLTDRKHEHHNAVAARLQEIPSTEPVYVSAVTAGEVEYGIRCYPKMPSEKKHLLRFVLDDFLLLTITENTKAPYASIRAKLFENTIKKGKKGMRPEQIVDPVTSLRLGVQENDIWITAQAVERGLTLVTHDRKMQRLWEAANGDLRVADWGDPEFAWPENG